MTDPKWHHQEMPNSELGDSLVGWMLNGDDAPPSLIECETCEGTGSIDERLGGHSFSDPAAICPDCDGTGELQPVRKLLESASRALPPADDEFDAVVDAALANVKPTSNDRQVRSSEPVPLWKVLFNEDCKAIAACERHVYADMLDALRDWLGEEPPNDTAPVWYNSDMASSWEAGRCSAWNEVRAILAEQAQIAREGK